MPRKKKTTDPVENFPHEQATHNESLSKRVRKHVGDQESKITDEDIRNVKVDVLPDKKGSTGSSDEQLPGETTTGQPKHITPWDVVSNTP